MSAGSLLSVVGKQRGVQVLTLRTEVRAEPSHLLFQQHQRRSDALDLLIGRIPAINATDGLTFHQLAQQFHQGKHRLTRPRPANPRVAPERHRMRW